MSKKVNKLKRSLPTIFITIIIVALIVFWIYKKSVSAYPGQLVYPVKKQIETLVKTIKNTPEEKITYEMVLADTRLIELKKVKDDVGKTKILIIDFNSNLENSEKAYEQLIKKGDNDLTYKFFERMNVTALQYMTTLEASRKTYPDSKDFKTELNEGSKRLNDFVDNLHTISVDNFGEYQKFLKYAIATYESYQYPRVYQEIQYAKEDFELIKLQATEELQNKIQSLIDAFETRYDEMMAKRSELTVKQIHDTLIELKKMEYEITLELVNVTRSGAKVVPSVTPTGE